jgi:hypothetical protein
MARFVNCKTISINDGHRPWGLSLLESEIGITPQRCLTIKSTKSIEFVRHLICTTITAAITSNIQIEVLEIIAGQLFDNASRPTPDMLIRPSSLPAHANIGSLRQLTLFLSPEYPEITSDCTRWTSDLVYFIDRFPQLSNFTLEFEYRDMYGLDVMDYSYNVGLGPLEVGGRFSTIASRLYIPHLEILRLSCIDCTSMELAFFLLRHHKKLRTVYLDSINLIDGANTWGWLMQILRDNMRIAYFSMNRCTAKEVEPGQGTTRRRLFEASDSDSFTHLKDIFDGTAK